MTRCVGISCVRNEADIVELWARYNLELLDELHVIDHLSADQTRWVLRQLQNEGLPLYIHTADDPAHRQAQLMNRVARALAERGDVDFIVPLDADELLAVASRSAFHAALARIPQGMAGAMRWRTFLPAADGDGQLAFFRRMRQFRSHEDPALDKLVLRSALARDHVWSTGCHNAFHEGTGQPVRRVALTFPLAHFPVRGADQLACKALAGADALLRNPQRGKREGWHWLALAWQLRQAHYQAQTLDLRAIALAYSLNSATLSQQQALTGAVPDYPDVQQRYRVELLSLQALLDVMQDSVDQTLVAMLWQRLGLSVRQPALWLELSQLYARLELPWQAAYTARQALRCDAGLGPQLDALGLGNWQDASAGDAWLGRASLPDAARLAAQFAARVEVCPGDWLSWLYLARLQEMPAASAQLPAAGLALQRAQALEPIDGESLHWIGVWRLNADDAQGAVTALSGLLDIRPLRFGSMMYLGEALQRTGNLAAAEKAFARAALSPSPVFLQTLAARMFANNYWQEALQILQKALSLEPDNVALLLNAATMQSEVYALADCRASLQRVRVLDPDNQPARLLDAGLQGRMGDAHAHLASLQAAYQHGGDPLSRLASGIAMTALYHDQLAPAEVAAWHRRLCAPIEAAVTQRSAFSNARGAARRLRIGCVTGDLHRQHPVNIFMLPLLQRFDHERFELFIYHSGTMHDAYTRQAKDCSDGWREVARIDDGALQRIIVGDQIDILIDLAGHTATHRLGVFALRAAPVQASFLGYPHSTGLTAIDWLIGDTVVTPADHAGLFSEGLAQLPGSVFCWAPVDQYRLPAARPAGAPLVFGSFNNAMKLSPTTIALWARILHAVPAALLLLKAPSLRDAAVRERFTALFAAHGIARERLVLRGPSGLADMMQEYGDVDIALDPTPYNGGTTTLQALWMGVPVVALRGGNFVSRMGASFMTTLDQPDWVADDEAGYVAAAVRLAAECATLRAGRAMLRAKMAQSKLCDIDAYVRNFESLLQRMWTNYRADGGQRLLHAVPFDA